MKQSLRTICLGLALGLAGSASLAQPTIASRVEEQGTMTSLQVTDMRAVRRDNLLRLQVEVTNTSTDNQQLYYRFKWLDQDGFVVWEEEPWKPLVIYGLQKKNINVVAPTFKATDFRFQVQSPDNRGDRGPSTPEPYYGGN